MDNYVAQRKEFGHRVRVLRRANRLSQNEFARMAGLARSHLGAIERGEKDLGFTSMTKIADALGVPLSDLVKDLNSK